MGSGRWLWEMSRDPKGRKAMKGLAKSGIVIIAPALRAELRARAAQKRRKRT
jgi:hypothetical protein